MKHLILFSALVAGACAPGPVTLRSEFTAAGSQGTTLSAAPAVVSSREVRIYYKASPPGFSLRKNELTVEEGFTHRILGEIRVRSNGSVNQCYAASLPTQHDVFQSLQQEAYRIGANAVIYAYSDVAQYSRASECERALETNNFGGAWAVVVSPEHLSPLPRSATPPTPATPAVTSYGEPSNCEEWNQRISETPNGRAKTKVIKKAPPECL